MEVNLTWKYKNSQLLPIVRDVQYLHMICECVGEKGPDWTFN
jgi:hypothetical protein